MTLNQIIEHIGVEPYYREDAGVIFNADCLDIMPGIPSESIDIILTDPPFNIGKYYNDDRCGKSDRLPENEYWLWYEKWMTEAFRVLKDQGFLYVSSMSKQAFKIREVGEAIGLRWFQMLIWYGPNMVGGRTVFRMPWTQLYEPITLFIKGKRQPMLNAGRIQNSHDVFVIARPQSNFKEGRHHVCQKPLDLYLRIISRTPGDIILDPFAGVFTSAVAAKQLNRRFVACDISSEYCDTGKQRLAQEILL